MQFPLFLLFAVATYNICNYFHNQNLALSACNYNMSAQFLAMAALLIVQQMHSKRGKFTRSERVVAGSGALVVAISGGI